MFLCTSANDGDRRPFCAPVEKERSYPAVRSICTASAIGTRALSQFLWSFCLILRGIKAWPWGAPQRRNRNNINGRAWMPCFSDNATFSEPRWRYFWIWRNALGVELFSRVSVKCCVVRLFYFSTLSSLTVVGMVNSELWYNWFVCNFCQIFMWVNSPLIPQK